MQGSCFRRVSRSPGQNDLVSTSSTCKVSTLPPSQRALALHHGRKSVGVVRPDAKKRNGRSHDINAAANVRCMLGRLPVAHFAVDLLDYTGTSLTV
jgi:hypothetical protein